MICGIKVFGAALLAAAVGGLAAASAWAGVGEVHIATEQKSVITGHTVNEALQIGTTTVQCKTGTLEGTISAGQEQATQDGKQVTTTHATVTAKFAEKIKNKEEKEEQNCSMSGLGPATVKMNGCRYTLRGTAELTAQVQVVGCTIGKVIEIVVVSGKTPLCTMTIGEQAEFGHVTFTNDGKQETTEQHLQDHETLSSFTYTRDGAFCPQGLATYQGTTTINAYQDLGTTIVQDPVTKHEYIEHLCGKEVGILST